MRRKDEGIHVKLPEIQVGAKGERLQAVTREILHALRDEFDLSFSTTVTEEDGKINLLFRQQDTGAEVMTLSDASAFLSLDRNAIRLMTEQRAQSRSNPIPFFKVGRTLRFKRSELLAWLERGKPGNGTPIIPPLPFGKQKKQPKKAGTK